VMVGTTDLEADPALPAICTEDEVDYFFDLVSHVFPTIPVDRSQIVYRFSGIRPLPKHDDTKPGFVSRDYNIVPGTLAESPETTVLSLVGGKWTTFRALGERLANEVMQLLGVSRTVSTEALAIGGGVGFPTTSAARADWIAAHRDTQSPERAETLLKRYGTRALDFVDAISGEADAPLATDPSYTTGEVRFIAANESVVHLIDVVLRRTNHAFTGDISLPLLVELGELVGSVLGWSDTRVKSEVLATADELKTLHGIALPETAASHK